MTRTLRISSQLLSYHTAVFPIVIMLYITIYIDFKILFSITQLLKRDFILAAYKPKWFGGGFFSGSTKIMTVFLIIVL